jgi:hypothetical protein
LNWQGQPYEQLQLANSRPSMNHSIAIPLLLQREHREQPRRDQRETAYLFRRRRFRVRRSVPLNGRPTNLS